MDHVKKGLHTQQSLPVGVQTTKDDDDVLRSSNQGIHLYAEFEHNRLPSVQSPPNTYSVTTARDLFTRRNSSEPVRSRNNYFFVGPFQRLDSGIRYADSSA